jgi:hypothetical protein
VTRATTGGGEQAPVVLPQALAAATELVLR